jgi:6-pyruvoyltetrahydropterin/6-carboxytetrahydropterin synthase
MYYIKRHFSFAGGHRLSKHEGLCKNIHGHNYDVWVTIRSPKLNENDMVMDFGDLKGIVEPYLSQYDHCLIVNKKDVHWMKPLADEMGFRTTIMDHDDRDPTAEVMAEIFFKFINDTFTRLFNEIKVDQVEVFENPKSSAVYRED